MKQLDALMREVRGEFASLCDGLNAGLLTPAEWHNSVLQTLADAYTVAAVQARVPSEAIRPLVLDAVTVQAEYLNGFTDAIERGDLSEAQIRARLNLYDGSVRAVYWQAETYGAELPFFPGDGSTPCQSHCKCVWQQRGGRWHWVLGATDEHCDVCRQRADGGPYG